MIAFACLMAQNSWQANFNNWSNIFLKYLLRTLSSGLLALEGPHSGAYLTPALPNRARQCARLLCGLQPRNPARSCAGARGVARPANRGAAGPAAGPGLWPKISGVPRYTGWCRRAACPRRTCSTPLPAATSPRKTVPHRPGRPAAGRGPPWLLAAKGGGRKHAATGRALAARPQQK